MIGQTIWVYDGNYRKYDEHWQLIKRECYRPYTIIDETPRSWVVDVYGRRGLVNKKTHEIGGALRMTGLERRALMSIEAVEDEIWRDENRFRLADAVRDCRDVATLRAIDALLKGTANE